MLSLLMAQAQASTPPSFWGTIEGFITGSLGVIIVAFIGYRQVIKQSKGDNDVKMSESYYTANNAMLVSFQNTVNDLRDQLAFSNKEQETLRSEIRRVDNELSAEIRSLRVDNYRLADDNARLNRHVGELTDIVTSLCRILIGVVGIDGIEKLPEYNRYPELQRIIGAIKDEPVHKS